MNVVCGSVLITPSGHRLVTSHRRRPGLSPHATLGTSPEANHPDSIECWRSPEPGSIRCGRPPDPARHTVPPRLPVPSRCELAAGRSAKAFAQVRDSGSIAEGRGRTRSLLYFAAVLLFRCEEARRDERAAGAPRRGGWSGPQEAEVAIAEPPPASTGPGHERPRSDKPPIGGTFRP